MPLVVLKRAAMPPDLVVRILTLVTAANAGTLSKRRPDIELGTDYVGAVVHDAHTHPLRLLQG